MPPRKKKAEAGSVGLSVKEIAEPKRPKEVDAVAADVDAVGGAVLSSYRDPFGGAWLVLAALPIDKIEPTPFQRELSETHAKRLADVIPKIGRFLDPAIAVRAPDKKGFWTPNGMHRLTALRALGGKSIIALIVPETEVAYRILAMNTEKAHNLKDKSLEVLRMARAISAADAKKTEKDYAFEFEEPAYLTVGMCYEENGRYSGGAYLPVLKRTDDFEGGPLAKSLEMRAARAKKLLELDAAVNDAVTKLKAAGLTGYLKPIVISRINPLRGDKPAKPGVKAPKAEFEATIKKMLDGAKKFDAKSISAADVAAASAMGPPVEE